MVNSGMRTAIILVLFLYCKVVSAQTNFLDSRNTWTEGFTCFGGGYWVTSCRFTIDSIPTEFNGDNYYEVLKSSSPMGDDFTGTSKFIRTDSFNHVYGYENGEGKLLYDFNLMLGDTFKTHNDFDCDIIVADIDTISLLNGEQRKKWIFYMSGEDYLPEYSYAYPYWIEGIGSQYALFGNEGMCSIDGCGSWYLCIFEQEELILQTSDTCWSIISSDIKIVDDNIKVYPNPVSGSLTIEDPDLRIVKMDVIDLLGNILVSESTTEMDISALPSGPYGLHLHLKDGTRLCRKFLKIP